jgi:hypothetical protein
MNGKDIVKTAKSFVGQQEIDGNQGFQNPRFETIMKSVGWKIGQAWCSYFAEAVYSLSAKGDQKAIKLIERLFSGSAVRTLSNFEEAGYRASAKAVEGSIVIWQQMKRGQKDWRGHVGIVIEVHPDHFVTIEGNTNSEGGREGGIVAVRKRKYSFHVHNGLELRGFIHPIGNLDQEDQDQELPFKNKKEGNKFRRWVNKNHPEIAKEIDLDPSGDYKNSYILKAYERLKELYSHE